MKLYLEASDKERGKRQRSTDTLSSRSGKEMVVTLRRGLLRRRIGGGFRRPERIRSMGSRGWGRQRGLVRRIQRRGEKLRDRREDSTGSGCLSSHGQTWFCE